MLRNARVLTRSLWIIIMTAVALLFAYPFFYGFLASFNSRTDFTQMGSLFPWPHSGWTGSAYAVAFQLDGALRPLINSFARSLWYTALTVLISVLVGYVLARYNFRGKAAVVRLIVIAQVIPPALTLIPSFVFTSRLPFLGGNDWLGRGGQGLINNPLMLYLPLGWGTLLWTFLFMQSLKSLPVSIEEAAEIDGCTFRQIIMRVIVPLQLPIIAVIAINTALATWNDWLTPFIYINDVQKSTLTAWLGVLTAELQQFGDKNYPGVFALATISIIPPFILFMVFQKFIIQGIASAGVKG